MDHPEVNSLCQRLDYVFRDASLLYTALTHKSFANEQPPPAPGDNERLEFLGDAVLDFIISGELMRIYPDLSEGGLSKMRAALVSEAALAALARELDLGAHLRMGKGERASGGHDKDSILSDALEAVIAAVYLDNAKDGQVTEVQRVVTGLFARQMRQDILPAGIEDSKTELQEWVQNRYKDTVRYTIVQEEGPDHDKRFEAAVFFQGKELGRGQGRSKKLAEQDAARLAMEELKKQG